MSRGEILKYLAETLSFAKTRQGFPFLTDSDFREILLEASSVVDTSPAGHKLATSNRLTFYIDGASRGNPGKAAVGVVIINDKGHVIGEKGKYIGETTNNAAEYQALLEALAEAKTHGGRNIRIYSDSELLVRQINGIYKVRDGKLLTLYNEAKRLISGFDHFKIDHITRDKNSRADALANEALDNHKRGLGDPLLHLKP